MFGVVAGNRLPIRLEAAAPTPTFVFIGSPVNSSGAEEIRLSRQGRFLVMWVDHPTKGLVAEYSRRFSLLE